MEDLGRFLNKLYFQMKKDIQRRRAERLAMSLTMLPVELRLDIADYLPRLKLTWSERDREGALFTRRLGIRSRNDGYERGGGRAAARSQCQEHRLIGICYEYSAAMAPGLTQNDYKRFMRKMGICFECYCYCAQSSVNDD